MDNEYSLENLVNRFEKHLVSYIENERFREKKFIEQFGEPPPKYGCDPDFYLPKALISICKEIINLKKLQNFSTD